LRLESEFDRHGDFRWGHAHYVGDCWSDGPPFCWGWVNEMVWDGDRFMAVIEGESYTGPYWPYSQRQTFTLTGEVEGEEIRNGRYFTSEAGQTTQGTFQAKLKEKEPSQRLVDLNRLFGNGDDKPPLDIRNELPQFDADNKPVPLTYPEGSILADIMDLEYHVRDFFVYSHKFQNLSYELGGLYIVLNDQFGRFPEKDVLYDIRITDPFGLEVVPSLWNPAWHFTKYARFSGEFQSDTGRYTYGETDALD